MEWLKKITDIIMPIDPEPEEEVDKTEVKKTETMSKESAKIEASANNSAAVTGTAEAISEGVGAAQAVGGAGFGYGGGVKFNNATAVRPPLTVIENKARELDVKVYTPTKYDQAEVIAADILGKNAAVVNYEYVESALQLRICDFLNGVCYVTDGYTDKISEKIFLYIPDGVETADIAEAVSSLNNGQYRRGMFAD